MAPIGRYFSLEELTFSQEAARRGLTNRPNPDAVASLRALCANILDPLREHLGPIHISSGYRSPLVNVKVGGASNSQHCLGQAADIIVPGRSIAFVVSTIRSLGLPFDQLIDEFGSWTHVSYGPRNRRQVLTARRVEGHTQYTKIG